MHGLYKNTLSHTRQTARAETLKHVLICGVEATETRQNKHQHRSRGSGGRLNRMHGHVLVSSAVLVLHVFLGCSLSDVGAVFAHQHVCNKTRLEISGSAHTKTQTLIGISFKRMQFAQIASGHNSIN